MSASRKRFHIYPASGMVLQHSYQRRARHLEQTTVATTFARLDTSPRRSMWDYGVRSIENTIVDVRMLTPTLSCLGASSAEKQPRLIGLCP